MPSSKQSPINSGNFSRSYREIFHILSFASSRVDDGELERWIDFLRMNFHFLPRVEVIEKLSAIGPNIRARQKLKLEAIVRSLLQVNMAAEAFSAGAESNGNHWAARACNLDGLTRTGTRTAFASVRSSNRALVLCGPSTQKTLVVEQIRRGLMNSYDNPSPDTCGGGAHGETSGRTQPRPRRKNCGSESTGKITRTILLTSMFCRRCGKFPGLAR